MSSRTGQPKPTSSPCTTTRAQQILRPELIARVSEGTLQTREVAGLELLKEWNGLDIDLWQLPKTTMI